MPDDIQVGVLYTLDHSRSRREFVFTKKEWDEQRELYVISYFDNGREQHGFTKRTNEWYLTAEMYVIEEIPA